MSRIAPQGIFITTLTFIQHLIQTSGSDNVDHPALVVFDDVAIRVLLRKVLAIGFGAPLTLMGADDAVEILSADFEDPSRSLEVL